jgi:23S rRNA (cytosine1962-C5)-methyltransferase
MIPLAPIKLKKGEDRRIRGGHPWIFSNEIDTAVTPLKSFSPGEQVLVVAHDKTILGTAYINPHSLIAARILDRDPNTVVNLEFFKQRLRNALSLRHQLFDKPFYRLVFSEADELPGLIIDRFANDLVLQINTAGMDLQTDIIIEAIKFILPDTSSILLRNDNKIREHEGLSSFVKAIYGTPPEHITIEENDVQFSIPLLKGQKTGWFYDHRQNRLRLKNYVNQRTVLDVFSYLGGWGIQAAVFGASQVDCIDASAPACEFIKTNATLNHVNDKVRVICSDAFDGMKEFVSQKKQYDVIVLDPPAFVKKSKDLKEGLVAYQRINELALRLLAPNGILMTCSCSMHVNNDEFLHMLRRAAYRAETSLQVLERGHQGPDHPVHVAIPETDYLKVVIARKLK